MSSSNKGKRILMVDDDPAFVEATRVVLEAKHYEVASAGDAKEAWQKIEEAEPDLVLLDVMMERLDSGFVLCRELKKNPRYKDIPILMLTGVDTQFHLQFSESAGDEDWLPVDAYLDKPVEPSRLLAEIEKLLKKK